MKVGVKKNSIDNGIWVIDKDGRKSSLIGWQKEYKSVKHVCGMCKGVFPPMTLFTQLPGYRGRNDFCPECFKKVLEDMLSTHKMAMKNRDAYLMMQEL
jgi:hypothetical protein